MLTEKVKGLSIIQGLALTKDYMVTLVAIELGPTRLRCALLPLEALHTALKEYQKRSDDVAQGSFTQGT
jgi:NifU-like protein involved in Fe-S cluster formation